MAASTAAVAMERTAKGSMVVLLTPSLDYGGAEMMIVALARWLHDSGWAVAIISMLPPRAFESDLRAHGIQVLSVDMSAGRLNVAGIVRLIAILRSLRPGLIHAHMFHANVLARLLRPFLGIPVVCTVHNILESSRRKDTAKLRDWAYRWTDWAAERTTAVAAAVRDRYVRDGLARKEKIATIPNGVDLDRFRPAPESRRAVRRGLGWDEAFVWLAVGRLELAKDYPTMLRALSQTAHHAKLAIVGAGRLRAELEETARQFGLEDRVEFLGVRTDIPALMQAADGFVMSSAWEGAPVVLMEAAASGLPVVATNAGGNAELVQHGVTGRIVDVGDAASLAAGMQAVMNTSPEERVRMGLAGRDFVEREYSMSAMFDRYERLYREVLRCNA